MHSPRLKLLSALLVGFALVAAGCHGTEASGGPPLTAAEFVVKGDEICSAATEERNAQAGQWFRNDPKPTRARREAFTAQVVGPSYRRQAEQLRGLTPPQGDEEQVEQFLRALEHMARKAERRPGELLDSPGQNGAAKLAAAYGFRSCGT